tara:strand:- start:743 stop:1954 length:1212 start_codon:yes stop_codon:yes gene_type:complete
LEPIYSIKRDIKLNHKMSYVLETYDRPVKENFASGKGSYLFTDKNEKYLDWCMGLAVLAFGHNHPKLVEAIKKYSEKPWHLSNLFVIQKQEKFAERICKLTGFHSVGFKVDGAGATDLAVKGAVRYFHSIGQKTKNRILCANVSFHGRNITGISAGNNPKHIEGFPLLKNFDHFEFGNLDDFKSKITDRTCAVFFEPIRGESGIQIVPDDHMREIEKICIEKNILLGVDECQAGLYRTGKYFSYMHSGIKPSMVTFAKAVAGSYPCAGVLFEEKIAKSFSIGSEGNTFAGSNLSMSLANCVMDLMLEDGFEKHIMEVSKYIFEKLEKIKNNFPKIIKEIRGRGLMIGLQINENPTKLFDLFLKNKLITVKAGDNVIRILPSLIASKEEIDEGIEIITKSCEEY